MRSVSLFTAVVGVGGVGCAVEFQLRAVARSVVIVAHSVIERIGKTAHPVTIVAHSVRGDSPASPDANAVLDATMVDGILIYSWVKRVRPVTRLLPELQADEIE